MEAIKSKFFGPTKTKTSRITVSMGDITKTFFSSCGAAYRDTETDHHHAAIRFAAVLGFTGLGYGKIVSGLMPKGVCAHVFTGVSVPQFDAALRPARSHLRSELTGADTELEF